MYNNISNIKFHFIAFLLLLQSTLSTSSPPPPYGNVFRNRLYIFGDNDWYELGSYENSLMRYTEYPNRRMDFYPIENLEILNICSTSTNSYFLTNFTVYATGYFRYCASSQMNDIFDPVALNEDLKFDEIKCSERHAIFRSSGGERTFYGIGSNLRKRMMNSGSDVISNLRDIREGSVLVGEEIELAVVGPQNSLVVVNMSSTNDIGVFTTGRADWGLHGLGNDYVVVDGWFGWIQMNDNMLVNEIMNDNGFRRVVYAGETALFFLMQNGDIYFLGENGMSSCTSITGDTLNTSNVMKLPIKEGLCNHNGVYSELYNHTIVELKCTYEVCFAISNESNIFSWGTTNQAFRMGRFPVSNPNEAPHAVDTSAIPNNYDIDDLIVRSVVTFVMVRDKGSGEKKVYGFGSNAGYFLFGYTDFSVVNVPSVEYFSMNYTYDLMISEGSYSFSIFLMLSTTCDGILANDSNVCSGHGNCYEFDSCRCDSSWFGEGCDLTVCFYVFSNVKDYVCSGHGNCTDYNECECKNDYNFVSDCSVWSCYGVRNDFSSVCSNNGDCLSPDECKCHFNQRGVNFNCSIPKCFGYFADEEEVCSGNGICLSNGCECSESYGGNECKKISVVPTIVGISLGSIFAASFALLFCFFVTFLICLCCCGGVYFIFTQSAKRKLKKFRKLEDVEMILQKQRLEMKDITLSKIKFDRKLFLIEKNDIKLIKILGEGGSAAVVYLAEWKGKNVAFKCFRTQAVLAGQNIFDEFESEVYILGSIHHPHIIEYYGSCLSPPRIGFVMEFCSNGDLSQYICRKLERKEIFEFSRKLRIIREICSVLMYLHSHKIIHRDLKLENVLLTSNLTSKVMDFGSSKFFEKTRQQKTKGIGTRYYMSPEIVLGKFYNEKTDVFSFGILVFVLLSEKLSPYGEERSFGVEFKVANNESFRPKFEKRQNVPQYLQHLCFNCWNHNPKERKSFEEIHAILKEEKHEISSSPKTEKSIKVISHSKINTENIIIQKKEIEISVPKIEKLRREYSRLKWKKRVARGKRMNLKVKIKKVIEKSKNDVEPIVLQEMKKFLDDL